MSDVVNVNRPGAPALREFTRMGSDDERPGTGLQCSPP